MAKNQPLNSSDFKHSMMISRFFFQFLGMWSTAFYFGNFVGPTLAGISVDAYGFRQTTVYFFGLLCAILIVDLFELSYTIRAENKRRKVGYEELS